MLLQQPDCEELLSHLRSLHNDYAQCAWGVHSPGPDACQFQQCMFCNDNNHVLDPIQCFSLPAQILDWVGPVHPIFIKGFLLPTPHGYYLHLHYYHCVFFLFFTPTCPLYPCCLTIKVATLIRREPLRSLKSPPGRWQEGGERERGREQNVRFVRFSRDYTAKIVFFFPSVM